MQRQALSAFAVRLRDVLATLETTALIGAADRQMRGVGEQLQFACMALPCDEALVAIERESLGRLHVGVVASAAGTREVDVELLPSGTPLAFLLGGGSGLSSELHDGDPILDALGGALESAPRHALFVPLRAGGQVIGGAVLLREDTSFDDDALAMGERLATVLGLTIEAFQTESVLLQVFARALPDLFAPDAATGFAEGLERYVHGLRLSPEYRSRLELAASTGRVASRGDAEAALAADILDRVDRYMGQLGTGDDEDDDAIEPIDADALLLG